MLLSFFRQKGTDQRQRPVVAHWALWGMSPEQNMAHTALIHIDQSITLRRVNVVPRPSDLPFTMLYSETRPDGVGNDKDEGLLALLSRDHQDDHDNDRNDDQQEHHETAQVQRLSYCPHVRVRRVHGVVNDLVAVPLRERHCVP